MCGIAGFIDEHTSKDDRLATLDQMCRVLVHRGPDDQGLKIIGATALGMRRLSIIDVVDGHQPMSGEDGTVTVVFNGEIYNFRELRKDLEARGHLFQTNSDTEAIVHGYEEFGPAFVNQLRGMFALAIWDEKTRTLFIARDRVGKKPLYYTTTPSGSFIFASELKALLVHPHVERHLDIEALDAYLTLGYVPDPLSIFRNIRKLPAGHSLKFSDGRLTIDQYWDFNFNAQASGKEEDYLVELRELLDESVRMRLVADVPLGAFLSGGVDSSAVVALMARNMGQPVKTFSIGFNEDSYSELKYARLTAKQYRTDHSEFIVTPEICQIVDELVWHFDEPFADSSAIPTYMVSKLARQHVKVVLSGDGGDELFAGYRRYLIEQGRQAFGSVPKVIRKGLMEPLSSRLPHGTRGRNFLHNISLNPIDRYLDSVSVFTRQNRKLLYTSDFAREVSDSDFAAVRFNEYAGNVKTADDLNRLLYLDCKTYLPGDILTKVDRMSMAVSLEARAPLLDHRLVDFVTRIPVSLKLAGTQTKQIFKRAVSDLIPGEVLNRGKQGFGIPIPKWINQELRGRIRETLTDSLTRQRGYFENTYISTLLEEHERGRRDHSKALWALLMLELWHRTFLDSPAVRNVGRHELAVT